jgi:alpha-D-ribose 1-methylphosphonate 5-triphosphate synthase subunit PhnI
LAYSTQRGYARNHPFAGQIRYGKVPLEFMPEELGFPIQIGKVALTECPMVNQFVGSKTAPLSFTRGYGLSFGHNERKAMAMALVGIFHDPAVRKANATRVLELNKIAGYVRVGC